jgi:hypothetical protein
MRRGSRGAKVERLAARIERPGKRQHGTLRCSPHRIYRGDTLTLEMSERYGGYLTVVNPRGDYQFLNSD